MQKETKERAREWQKENIRLSSPLQCSGELPHNFVGGYVAVVQSFWQLQLHIAHDLKLYINCEKHVAHAEQGFFTLTYDFHFVFLTISRLWKSKRSRNSPLNLNYKLKCQSTFLWSWGANFKLTRRTVCKKTGSLYKYIFLLSEIDPSWQGFVGYLFRRPPNEPEIRKHRA